LETKFLMSHLAPAKAQRDFDLHFLTEKFNRVIQFDAEVVRVNGRTQLNFLNFIGVVVLFRLFIFLGLFVAELAKIDQTTHRRRGVRRNFHQVHPFGSRQVNGISE